MHNAQRKRRRDLERQLTQPRTPSAHPETFKFGLFVPSATQMSVPVGSDGTNGASHPFQHSTDIDTDIDIDAETMNTDSFDGSLDEDLMEGIDIDGLLRSLESDQMTQMQIPSLPAAARPSMLLSTTGEYTMEQTALVQWPAVAGESIAPLVHNTEQWSLNLTRANPGSTNSLIFGAAFQSPPAAAAPPCWNPSQPQPVQQRITPDLVTQQGQPQVLNANDANLFSASYSLFDMAPSELPADVHNALASTLGARMENNLFNSAKSSLTYLYSLGSPR